MKIDYREELTDQLPEMESASLWMNGLDLPAGIAEVLAEAASGRLRSDRGEEFEVQVSRHEGKASFDWPIDNEHGWLEPHQLYGALLAEGYGPQELAAAREACLARDPGPAGSIPEDPAELAAAVRRLQDDIAAPPAGFAIEAVGDHFSEGTVWAVGEGAAGVPRGSEAAILARAGTWFARLAGEVGEERARQVCSAQDRALAVFPSERAEAARTAREFEALSWKATNDSERALKEAGTLSGLSRTQRELALALVASRVSGLLPAALGRAAGSAGSGLEANQPS